jgi:RNA polymerase sigma-70 factor, ECF subfamily
MGADQSELANGVRSGGSWQVSSRQDRSQTVPSQQDSSLLDSSRLAPFPAGDRFSEHLALARAGNDAQLGDVLESCRDYLLLIANREEMRDLRPKVAPSDLVQETFVEARRDLNVFCGSTPEQFRGWLRAILLHNLADATRQYRDAAMRQLDLEVPLDDLCELEIGLQKQADGRSPGSQVVACEELERLETALDQLTPDLRRIVELRNLHECSFVEIGQLMDLSRYAVRRLWSTALVELGAILEKVP